MMDVADCCGELDASIAVQLESTQWWKGGCKPSSSTVTKISHKIPFNPPNTGRVISTATNLALEFAGRDPFNPPNAGRVIVTPGAQVLATASFAQQFCQRLTHCLTFLLGGSSENDRCHLRKWIGYVF
jgi:hypothetical protein